MKSSKVFTHETKKEGKNEVRKTSTIQRRLREYDARFIARSWKELFNPRLAF